MMFGMFAPLSFVAEVTQRDGPELERLLAPRTPGAEDTPIGGAIIEASYLLKDPPIVARLADGRTPWVTNPQSVRFATSGFRQKRSILALPYAPDELLNPAIWSQRIGKMVLQGLEFQAQHEPSMYMVPSLPLTRVSEPIFRVFAKIHEEAASLNGSAGIPQRPMLAAAFPCTAVVKGRYSVFERVLDRAFAGAYVQPLALDTKRDSVEKLTRYAQFLTHAKSSGLPVVAGRASAFGLVLAAAGIDFFDSGLSLAGSFSLSRLDRPPRAPKPGDRSGGPKPALYFHQFLAPIEHHDAEAMLSNPAVRAQLSCRIGECGSADYKYSLENPRAHFFHTRQQELRDIRALPTIELRVQRVYDWIQSAIENGRLVNRIGVAPDGKPLDFSYLDRWLGVLSRLATPVAVANQ